MARLSSGTSRKWSVIGSDTESLPISSSFRIAAAVNCLVIEPVVNTVSEVTGRSSSGSILP